MGKQFLSDMPIDRLPPHAPEAEQAVIGCCLLTNDAIDEVLETGLSSEWFYDLRLRDMWTVLSTMRAAGIPIDLISLPQKLRDAGKLEAVGGIAYITALIDGVPSASIVGYYVGMLRDKWLLRKAIAVCTEHVSKAYEGCDAEDVVASLERDSLAIRDDKSDKRAETMQTIARRVVENIEKRMTSGEGVISTGFTDLDKYTSGGLKDSEMWIMAARPSLGKTSLAMNIAANVADAFRSEWLSSHAKEEPYAGQSVLVFSLEMTAEALTERMVSSYARVGTRRTEAFNEREMVRLTTAVGVVSKLPLIIEDSPMTLGRIMAKARRHVSRDNTKVIVVDYLQCILSTPDARSQDRRVEVDGFSRGLKQMAKELKVPVLVAAQLNRDLEREKNRRPRMSDLREAGGIEADADFIGFLYKPSSKGEEEESDSCAVNLLIGKQRNGMANVDVALTFLKQFTRFESAAKVCSEDYRPTHSDP